MKQLHVPNADERELRRFRQFYFAYPIAGRIFVDKLQIRGTLPPELEFGTIEDIRGSSTPEIQIPEKYYENLFNRISYSHFVELIRITDPVKRLFYELECTKGTWSIKELKRQIGSLLYERTGLSENKKKLVEMAQTNTYVQTPGELIRDPYIFEFLGLKKQEVLPEKEIEQALLDHLLNFLMEWGKGFVLKPGKSELSLIMNILLLIWYFTIESCIVAY